MATLPAGQAGVAAGTFSTAQEIGGAMGLAITITVVKAHHDFVSGYHEGLIVMIAFGVLGFGASLLLRR